MVRTFVVVCIAALAAFPVSSSAQEWFAGGWAVQMGQTGLMTQALNRPLAQYSRRQGPRQQASAPSRSFAADLTRPAPATLRTAFDGGYRTTPAVRRDVEAEFLDFIRSQSPGDVPAIQRGLAERDFVDTWRMAVAENGLAAGDMADSLTAYLILNWMMVHGADAERPETLAARAQVRSAMAANPTFSDLSDAERQAFSETLMLNFLIQQATYVDALRRGDAALQRRMGEAARIRFQNEFGMDLTTMSLTPNGFTMR